MLRVAKHLVPLVENDSGVIGMTNAPTRVDVWIAPHYPPAPARSLLDRHLAILGLVQPVWSARADVDCVSSVTIELLAPMWLPAAVSDQWFIPQYEQRVQRKTRNPDKEPFALSNSS